MTNDNALFPHASEFALSDEMQKLATRILRELINPCRQRLRDAEKNRDDGINHAQRELADVEAQLDARKNDHRSKHNDLQSNVNLAVGELDGICAAAAEHLRNQNVEPLAPRSSENSDEGTPERELPVLIGTRLGQCQADLQLIRQKKKLAYWPEHLGARWAIGITSVILLFVFFPLIFSWPVIAFFIRYEWTKGIISDYQHLVEEIQQIRVNLHTLARRSQKDTEAAITAAEESLLPPAKRTYAVAIEAANNRFKEDVQKIGCEFLPVSDYLHSDVNQLWKDSAYAATEWNSLEWKDWSPDRSPEFAARIGTLAISAEDLQSKIKSVDFNFSLPALIPFGRGRCLLLSATAEAKDVAAEALQSTVIRALANTPAGKARFTLIDPVGLGHNVADFMHLGDFNPELINGKAWTEPQHIEQQLTRITEEMETVIQKYLRKQYASIQEYNQVNHEVAEPFRFLVIFDFPVNFNETSVRRLISIVKNGPRCGVFTMILVDSSKALPYGCESVIEELRQSAAFFPSIV